MDGSDPPKPIAFWIMQILSLICAIRAVVYGWKWTNYASENTPRGNGGAGAVVFSIFFVLLIWMLAIGITAYRRMPVVRWLGGAFIVSIILLGLSAIFPENQSDPTDKVRQLLRFGGGVTVAGAACYWLYAFAFSAKSRRYLGLP